MRKHTWVVVVEQRYSTAPGGLASPIQPLERGILTWHHNTPGAAARHLAAILGRSRRHHDEIAPMTAGHLLRYYVRHIPTQNEYSLRQLRAGIAMETFKLPQFQV